MFKNIIDYTNQLEDSAEYTLGFLRKLRGGRKRLSNKIIAAETQVKSMKNETKFVAGLKASISKEALSAAKDVLYSKVQEALRTNIEFDEPPYRKALLLAIQDNDTYMIRSSGSGFKSKISVDINLNKTAGRLDLWARAVKLARKELQVKVPNKNSKKREMSAIQASRAWAAIFDKRTGTFSKFSKTVRLRLKFSALPAPFWQLLDKGDVALASDRGGYPTPKKSATNFVHESEVAVNNYISGIFSKKKKEYDRFFSNYQVLLDDAKEKLLELDALIDQISLNVRVIKNLEAKLENVNKYTDNNKLEKAVQLIQEGLISASRVQISGQGINQGKRFSTGVLEELL